MTPEPEPHEVFVDAEGRYLLLNCTCWWEVRVEYGTSLAAVNALAAEHVANATTAVEVLPQ